MSNNVSLSSSAMLVELSISAWQGRKLDKNATRRVAVDHNADKHVANVNKALLPNSPELELIHNIKGRARNHVLYRLSMPWFDTGIRLLSTAAFFDFHEQITDLENQFNNAVDAFLDMYNLRMREAKYKLGDLFNVEDYPFATELRSKFAFKVNYYPLPESGDFRVDINNAAVEALQERYESAYEAKMREAMNDIWQRVHKSLSGMSSALGYDDNGKKRIFRDSMVENAADLIDVLRKCNITNDIQLEAIASKLDDMLTGVSAERLRDDEYLRDDTKRGLDEILKSLPSLDL